MTRTLPPKLVPERLETLFWCLPRAPGSSKPGLRGGHRPWLAQHQAQHWLRGAQLVPRVECGVDPGCWRRTGGQVVEAERTG